MLNQLKAGQNHIALAVEDSLPVEAAVVRLAAEVAEAASVNMIRKGAIVWQKE